MSPRPQSSVIPAQALRDGEPWQKIDAGPSIGKCLPKCLAWQRLYVAKLGQEPGLLTGPREGASGTEQRS